MPCYERVVVEVDFVIRDHEALAAAVKAKGGVFRNGSTTRFTVGGIDFTIADQKIRSETSSFSAKEIEGVVDGLRQQYARESIKKWAAQQRASVTERADGEIIVRKWTS